MMLKRILLWLLITAYVLLALYLFFNFPDTEVNVREQSVWFMGMTLTGGMGFIFCVMPVAGVMTALRRSGQGQVFYTLYPSVVSLSMAATVYLLRLFSQVMAGPQCLVFFFLSSVTAIFLWHFYILLPKMRE